MSNSDPFKLLLDMEARSLSSSAGLPTDEQVDDEWVGIGFRVGEDRLMAPMDEVAEILDMPDYTSVPGVKPWVIGVANVRGNLLPLMDLQGFLLGEAIKKRRKGKVIVIQYKGFNTGLLVEEVLGMKHFGSRDQSSEIPEVHENIQPFVRESFNADEADWPVFDFERIQTDENFANASL